MNQFRLCQEHQAIRNLSKSSMPPTTKRAKSYASSGQPWQRHYSSKTQCTGTSFWKLIMSTVKSFITMLWTIGLDWSESGRLYILQIWHLSIGNILFQPLRATMRKLISSKCFAGWGCWQWSILISMIEKSMVDGVDWSKVLQRKIEDLYVWRRSSISVIKISFRW